MLGVNASAGRVDTLTLIRRTATGISSQPTVWEGVTTFDLALSDTGLAVASLTELGRSTQRIMVSRAARDGAWETPSVVAVIDQVTPYGGELAPVAVDASGTATVAWRQGRTRAGGARTP